MTISSAAVANRYQSVQVTTCSPGQLLVMLYDGLFRFMNEAHVAMTAGIRARAGERIGKAHAILEELLVTIDPKAPPQLLESLTSLYRFCMSRLVEANLFQDPTRIADVQRLLSPVRDAWREVVNAAK